jgi:hypothetical protein
MQYDMNPYQVPEVSQPSGGPVIDAALAANGYGMMNQLTILGILQIVQGILEALMGGLLVVMAFIMPQFAMPGPQTPSNAMVMYFITIYYGVAGGLTLFFGVLRIFAGTTSFWIKGRLLMYISLVGGLASCLTIYCTLTSIPLLIYGIIVLKHPAVKMAYQMAKKGMTAREIRDAFGYARYQRPSSAPVSFRP